MIRNFLIQKALLGDLSIRDSMLNNMEFIESQIRGDNIKNLIDTIDYRWKDEQ